MKDKCSYRAIIPNAEQVMLFVYGVKQTEKNELTNIIRVVMQKGQSCFLIHFELVSLFGA